MAPKVTSEDPFWNGLIAEYNTDNPDNHPEFDPAWLEETHAGFLDAEILNAILRGDPRALRDGDSDGYVEVSRELLRKVLVDNPHLEHEAVTNALSLSPFFDDRAAETIEAEAIIREFRCAMPLGCLDYFSESRLQIPTWPGNNDDDQKDDRLKYVPEGLKAAVAARDFDAAGEYFAAIYPELKNHGDPFKGTARMLASYIAASLVHSGMDWTGDITDEDPGMSVHGSGRLRTDCEGHTQLAFSALKDIPELEFYFVTLSGEKLGTSPADLTIGDYPARSYMRDMNIEDLTCDEILRFDLYRNVGPSFDPANGHYVIEECAQLVPRGNEPSTDYGSKSEVPCSKGDWEYEGEIVSCRHYVPRRWQRDGLPDDENPVDLMVSDQLADGLKTYLGHHDAVHKASKYGEVPRYEFWGEEDEGAFIGVNDEEVYRVFYPKNGGQYNPFITTGHSTDGSMFFPTPQPRNADETGAHMIGVAHIPGQGYLVQDNHMIRYLDGSVDIWAWVRKKYEDKYPYMSRGTTPHDEENAVEF